MRAPGIVMVMCLLVLGCGGSGGGSRPSQTEATTSLDADQILATSDDAMNELGGLLEEVIEGQADVTMRYRAPDRAEGTSIDGGWSWCVIGTQAWNRLPLENRGWGPWEPSSDPVYEWKWPDYDRTTRTLPDMQPGGADLSNLRIIEETELDGRPVWIIGYEYNIPTFEGLVPASAKEWIDKDTFWLLKAEQWQDDPFGFTGTTTTIYSEHNEPQEINCGEDDA